MKYHLLLWEGKVNYKTYASVEICLEYLIKYFYRNFRLILTPKKGLLHHQFEAISVDAEGNETPVTVGMF